MRTTWVRPWPLGGAFSQRRRRILGISNPGGLPEPSKRRLVMRCLLGRKLGYRSTEVVSSEKLTAP